MYCRSRARPIEATIRDAGVGVEPSLRGFALGYDRAKAPMTPPAAAPAKIAPPVATPGKAYAALLARAQAAFPVQVHDMLAAGLQRVVDFQDIAYGEEYLALLGDILKLDDTAKAYALTRAAAKYLAVAMAYDDVYRVADLKTRATRFARVRAEIGVPDDQLVHTTEFMHPRMDEVTGSLPVWLGRFIESRPGLFRALDRIVNRGRRVKTDDAALVPAALSHGRHEALPPRHAAPRQRSRAPRCLACDA